MNKTTVVYHDADFDGLFCREIARKFLPDAELVGWNFGDQPLDLHCDQLYILDLPCDKPFGKDFTKGDTLGFTSPNSIIWIDHHKSSIESHPKDIPGYRIDGVAACRLAYFYFTALERYKAQTTTADFTWFQGHYPWATKQDFIDRKVKEPLAVRLAGEYDIWDKRDDGAELFQHGLRSCDLNEWAWSALLWEGEDDAHYVNLLLDKGKAIQYARDNEYREVITQQGFDIQFEGLTFLACNSHELDIRSQLFEAGIKPHHDGLLGFTFNGKDWRVSLYGVPSKPDIDLSAIAVKHGGGGHKQACGFRATTLPFLKAEYEYK